MDNKIKRGLLLLRSYIDRIIYEDYEEIKSSCNGMLRSYTYKKIHDEILKLAEHDIVEIGAAHGAITVAVGRALKERESSSRIVVVEKFEGGSRSEFGNKDKNKNKFLTNIKRYGLEQYVKLFPEHLEFDNADEVKNMINGKKISALIHDADGRVDRDFFLFYPMLIDGGLVVIDDYEDKKKYVPVSNRYPRGGVKAQMTYRLVKQFLNWELIREKYKVDNTLFCIKNGKFSFDKSKLEKCKRIIDNLKREHAEYIERMQL